MRTIIGFITIYCFAYLLFFWQTPLGIEAVLDGAENLLLSEQISTNSLPAEPFYRSMLYQYFLASFRFIGISSDAMHTLASFLGILLHIFNAFLVSRIAFKLWNNSIATYASTLLYGFYPPLIFFAAEPIDVTLAITFMLSSLYFFIKAYRGEQNHNLIFSGLALGLGVLTRSNLLPLCAIFLLEPLITKKLPKALAICLLTILLGQGVSYYISNEFHLLPWQNSYNLYSANKQGANGKYYQNTLYVADRPLGSNPARIESEQIYFNDTGLIATQNLSNFNRYWLNKFTSSLRENPKAAMSLFARKLYFTFNNFEQYNNKTFIFHKLNSPILQYNPLCFGFIFTLFIFVLFNHRRLCNPEQRRLTLLLAGSLLLLSFGTVLYYTSAKFRLLIVPIMIPVAGGFFSASLKRYLGMGFKLLKPALTAVLAAFISFSTYLNAADTSTIKEDMLLISQASARLGMYDQQVYWASQTLLLDPNNISATRVRLVGISNLLLNGTISKLHNEMSIDEDLNLLSRLHLKFPDTNLITLYHSTIYNPNLLKICDCLARLGQNDLPLLLVLVFRQLPESNLKEYFT